MSKYDIATLLSSGSVGKLKRSTETDPLEWEERAIFMWTNTYESYYRNFGNFAWNMNEVCIKWIILLDFNEISCFALIAFLIVIKEMSF